MNIPTSSQAVGAFSGFPAYEVPSELTSTEKNVEETNAEREAFDNFVGQTFFKQMLSAMRKTVDEPAYFHGGQTEEVFQNQLDQVLSERMTDAAASEFTDPMFELYSLKRA
jgi:peptidoglycan hydrolase FlgJ